MDSNDTDVMDFNDTDEVRFASTVDSPFTYIGAVLSLIFISIGVFGNGLTLVALKTCKHLQKIPNIPIATMTVSDLLYNLTIMPIHLHVFIAGGWPYENSPGVCWFLNCGLNVFLVQSALHIPIIAVHRYLIVVHPALNQNINLRGKGFIMMLLFIVFIITFSLYLVPRLVEAIRNYEGVFFTAIAMNCSYKGAGYTNYISGAGVLVIICTISYSYIRILRVVAKSKKNLKAAALKSKENKGTDNKQELKLIQSLIVIFIVFFCTYTATPVLRIVDPKGNLHFAYYFSGTVLQWSASVSNWIIYGAMNRDFNVAFKTVLRIKGNKVTETETSSSATKATDY